jgi:hypothetical protein
MADVRRMVRQPSPLRAWEHVQRAAVRRGQTRSSALTDAYGRSHDQRLVCAPSNFAHAVVVNANRGYTEGLLDVIAGVYADRLDEAVEPKRGKPGFSAESCAFATYLRPSNVAVATLAVMNYPTLEE